MGEGILVADFQDKYKEAYLLCVTVVKNRSVHEDFI